MTFDYRILPEHHCIAQRFTGHVSFADVARASETMWRSPRYNRGYHVLSDLREVTTTARFEDAKALSKFCLSRPEMSTGLWAAIFSTPGTTALGYLFRATLPFAERFGVFSSWEGACGHLQVEIPPSVFSVSE